MSTLPNKYVSIFLNKMENFSFPKSLFCLNGFFWIKHIFFIPQSKLQNKKTQQGPPF